jgi:class 3 adenylate cyclase
MLMGRYGESAEACRTALANQPGDTSLVAAQAHNYLGVDLVSLGQVEAGLDELLDARRIAAAAGGPLETLMEANHNYACMLDRADRLDEAATEALAGAAAAAAAGLGRRSGIGLRAVAAIALIRRGRWREAGAVLDESAALGARGAAGLLVRQASATLDVGRGRTIQAAADLAAARTLAGDGARADSRPPLVAAEVELAILERRWDDASIAATAEADRLAPLEDGYWIAPLAALGVRAEADRTEATRAKRVTIGLAESRARAAHLLAACRTSIAATTMPTLSSQANAALTEAEWTRVEGTADPAAWAEAAAAFEAVPEPLGAGYARFRQAEAILALRAGREEATNALRSAVRIADDLGAEPLREEAVALARRARLDIASDDASTTDSVAAEPSPAAVLGLTRRETEILALVARGRTNQQIGEELFITAKTVGVHMTNILAKLGVTNRIDAAAIADRLGIGRERLVEELVAPFASDDLAGARSSATPRHRRARRTFLITDIVRSTALIGVIGDDAWVDLRRWHDLRLRSIFATHRGEELDHAGDGFLVAFERTSDALDCAIEIQRTLADHRRREGFAPSVRIGVHASEAVHEGAGFTGRAIHEGARIAALAGADEIVASLETIRDAPPRTGPLATRTVTLRGIAEPVTVATIPWRTS